MTILAASKRPPRLAPRLRRRGGRFSPADSGPASEGELCAESFLGSVWSATSSPYAAPSAPVGPRARLFPSRAQPQPALWGVGNLPRILDSEAGRRPALCRLAR